MLLRAGNVPSLQVMVVMGRRGQPLRTVEGNVQKDGQGTGMAKRLCICYLDNIWNTDCFNSDETNLDVLNCFMEYINRLKLSFIFHTELLQGLEHY